MSSTLSAEPTDTTRAAPSDVTWARAGARLVARAVAELTHEQLLSPEPTASGRHRLRLGEATYTFTAERDGFTAWHVDPASVRRDDAPATDLARFFLDARDAAGFDPVTLAEIVREATATQAAEARILATGLPVAELLDLDYADLEQQLTGHPLSLIHI